MACKTCNDWQPNETDDRGVCQSKAQREEKKIPANILYITFSDFNKCNFHKGEKEWKKKR